MNEQERAEQHLRIIRRMMERATVYRAISAPTALVGGLLSLAASAIWIGLAAPYFRTSDCFLSIWICVLILTAFCNAVFIFVSARRRSEPVFSTSMKIALKALAPPFAIAGMITMIVGILLHTDPLYEVVLSLNWTICYGMGLLATSQFAPRSLVLLGLCFFVSGGAVLLGTAFGSESFLHLMTSEGAYWLMATTFGLYHLIYAACVWPRKGAAPET